MEPFNAETFDLYKDPGYQWRIQQGEVGGVRLPDLLLVLEVERRPCRADAPRSRRELVGQGRALSRAELESIGYKIAIFPVTALLASVQAMSEVYATFKAQGSSAGGQTALYDFGALTRLMGFEAVWEFEKRHAETD